MGLVSVISFAVVSYLANAVNLTGVLNPALAGIVALIFTQIEGTIQTNSGKTTALLGAVKLA